MKNILRLMGALALTAGATPSVVACGNNGSNISNNPQLNGKYAELLGWYSDENTSIIDEVINFDNLGTYWERTDVINKIQICLKIIKLDKNNFDFNMQLYVNLNTCKILVNNNIYFCHYLVIISY
ncbi:hypothetical protein [Spiroplasma endosymbiont of Thecophora atra]|uniref:hypothetical protein n=1 Tax=Spiroplasma endosymbiont of Thecophora atra TaxID=3066294 RepID=UPI0030D21F32